MINNKDGLAKIAKNNAFDMDMITIMNYIEHTLTMITDQPSIISKSTRIMIALYLFGDMPSQEIAEKTFLKTSDIASKASHLRKTGQIEKHGIYFHLTDESRKAVEEFEERVKASAERLDKNDLILLYNSYIAFCTPFFDFEERPPLMYLVVIAIGVYEHMCWELFNGKHLYSRTSILYYTEVFEVMDYVKLSHLIAKSLQNIQILARRLEEEGWLKIAKRKIRHKRPDITITDEGREELITSVRNANKGASAVYNSIEEPLRENFIKSLNGMKYIAIKQIQASGLDKEF